MRVIIAGSRDFNDYKTLKETCDYVLKDKGVEEIVSGKARGADKLGERYARFHKIPIADFPADWNDFSEPCVIKYRKDGSKYNALAGKKRNQKMADYAVGSNGSGLIAFDMGTSGTNDMIKRALKKGLWVYVHEINKK